MTDKPSDAQEKKIIVDEDWKTQVEAEKEELKRRSPPQRAAEAELPPPGPLPPPTLDFLVSSFAMQAMVALGMMTNPVTNKTEVQLEQAKHFIDTIEMLQVKTEGNRTPEENAMMENIIHELRLTYVSIQQNPPS